MNDNSNKIILDLCGGTGAWSKPYKDAGYDVRVITMPQYDVNNFDYAALYKACCEKCEKRVRDRSFIGAGSSRQSMTGVHVECKKTACLCHVPKVVYGILAAPPCTMFSLARTKAKKPRDLKEGMECVRSCLDIIWKRIEIQQDTRFKKLPLKFWALENPNFGLLKYFLGNPLFVFNPYDFGDPYQKQTAIWGYFNEPKKQPIPKPPTKKGNRGLYDYTKSKFPKFGSDRDISFRFDAAAKSITPAGFAKAFFEANP